MSGTVLLVEDEPSVGELVRGYLSRDGYRVIWVRTGEEALVELERHPIRLVLLDIGLPGKDGFDVCREIRARSYVPILMLTARDEEPDRIVGLEVGADDYITKPFSPRELVARVAAVLRRGPRLRADERQVVAAPRPPLTVGNVSIDRDRHEVCIDGTPLAVTATELRLLSALAHHRGRVLSRMQLIESVYGSDHHITERTIDTHVRNLRAKLVAAGAPVVETVHGVGYRCG
jgi:DNA-binding response OmpR family regulator